MYFYELVEILEMPENFNTTAIRKIGHMEYFEYDFDSMKSLERFFKDNNMDKTMYAVVGEDDGGFDTIIALVDYTKGKVVFERPGDEWKKFYREYDEGVEIPMKCYTKISEDIRLRECYYLEQDFMKYEEYKPLLDNAMVEYVNNGYSTFYIGSAIREYFFDYLDPMLPYDSKKHLSDKAIQCIIAKKPLPDGIVLNRVVLHERKK